MNAKEFYPGVFSRQAVPYRARLEHLMRTGEAAARYAVMDAVRARRGMRILDLACGPGTISIPMAREMAGEGEVIGIDLADGMLESAREAALGKGLPVRFLKMDLEVLQFPPQSFDAVTCAHGLQFAPNLGRALREAHRVLKTRGRLAASLPAPGLAPSLENDALSRLFLARLGPPPTPEDARQTRAVIEDPDRLQAAAVQAGLRAVEIEKIDSEVGWDSPQQFVEMSLSMWSYASRLEGLSAHVLEMLTAEAARAIEEVAGPGPFTVQVSAHVLIAEA